MTAFIIHIDKFFHNSLGIRKYVGALLILQRKPHPAAMKRACLHALLHGHWTVPVIFRALAPASQFPSPDKSPRIPSP